MFLFSDSSGPSDGRECESHDDCKDDTASLAEDGMNCQADTDVFRELMGFKKYFDLYKMTFVVQITFQYEICP